MAEPRNGAARASRSVPVRAIGAFLIGTLGCLNPIPDDFPNQRDEAEELVAPPGGPTTAPPVDDVPRPGSQGGEGDAPESPPVPSSGAPTPGEAEVGDAGVARAAARRSDAGLEAPDAGPPSEALP